MSKPSEPVRGPAKLEYRNQIARTRQIPAQEREIQMLHCAGVSTASAELLLSRMRAKVDDLYRDREARRRSFGKRPSSAPPSRRCKVGSDFSSERPSAKFFPVSFLF